MNVANINDLEMLLSALTAQMSDNELLFSKIQADIAAAITEKRLTLDMSQKELADKLAVSQSMVSKWEKGDCNYTLQTLVNIALALDISLRSPFVNKAPYRHSAHDDNVLPFPAVWISEEYTPSNEDYRELEEM